MKLPQIKVNSNNLILPYIGLPTISNIFRVFENCLTGKKYAIRNNLGNPQDKGTDQED